MTNNADECWYSEVTEITSLDQGQLLFNFVVYEVESTEDPPSLIDERVGTWIIATQSCDMDTDKILIVAVDTASAMKLGKDKLSAIAKGNRPLYHLLPPFREVGICDYLVCDFADAAIVPKRRILSFLERSVATPRVDVLPGADPETRGNKSVRLLPPYREHFSAAVGRAFARVALKQNTWERADFGVKKLP
jgi:hypothetical protein